MNARTRKAIASVAVVLTAPALASCGVNFSAQTDQIYIPTDGQNHYDGSVDVLHALVVSDTPGSGRIIAGLVNNDNENDDALTGVTGTDAEQGLTVTLADDVTIPRGGLVQLADEEAPAVFVTGDEEILRPGRFVRVTFTFERGEPATLNIPVMPPGSDYAELEISDPGTGASTGEDSGEDSGTDEREDAETGG